MVYQHKYKFILYFSHYKEKVFLYLIHFFIKKLGAQTFESIKLMATKKCLVVVASVQIYARVIIVARK
jgi:hypothetical protein